MRKIAFTLSLIIGTIAQCFAYDFSVVCESGQTLYYSINQGTETVQLVKGNYGNGDVRPSGNLIIPASVEHGGITYQIQAVGYAAFEDCVGLHSVVFSEPSFVNSLYYYSFSGCVGLISVLLPNSIQSIEGYSFKGCTALNTINFPEGIASIGYQAFVNCSSLENVVLPETLVEIKGEAFRKCVSLNSMIIPNSLISMGDYSFAGCEKLTTLIIGNSLEIIARNAFANCEKLQSVIFIAPSSLKVIESNAFDNCGELAIIEFPESLVTIGSESFKKCVSLKDIILSDGVESIGSYAFIGCSSVESIKFSSSLKEINNSAFREIPLVTTIYIPDNVILVGDYAFAKCSGLKEVVIGNMVTTIGSYTFLDCSSLENVVLGCNVTNLGYYAFDGTNLNAMTVKASLPPIILSNTFQGISRDIPITIPCGSLERYQNKDYWDEFTNYTEDFVLSFVAMSENDELGTVNIIKEPMTCDDMMVEVEAVEKNGSVFKGWEANGVFVSNENPYSFILEEDIVLIARFSGMGLEESGRERIDVYPNPTNGTVTIDGLKVAEVKVYDALGQLVKESKENVIDLSAQEAGTYLIKVITPSGVVTKQIIKK